MRPLSPKEKLLAPIIEELIAANPQEINVVMAEEAASRLGRKVSRSEISSVKTLIGLAQHQVAARRVAADVMRELLADNAPMDR